MGEFFSHATAEIDQGAKIGAGSKIWHFCHVMRDAEIGENCILGQNVFIGQGVTIGSGVKIQNNVSVYTGVIIEDDVFLGPSMVFTNVINPRSAVERKHELKTTIVGKGSTIGANATIICGIRLGQYCFIGAGAVVTRDIPDYALVAGNPARQTGWMSERGHKLAFGEDGTATCPEDGSRYSLQNNKVHRIQ